MLAPSEMNSQTVLRGTVSFRKVSLMSLFAVCEKKVRVRCSVKSTASVIAASKEVPEERGGDYCFA